MRAVNWNWQEADKVVAMESLNRVRKAAEVIAARARRECPVGTVSRPMYKSGPYAGQEWTARDAGQLKKSIRVVEKHEEKWGHAFKAFGTTYGLVRVYAGTKKAFYARIVEYSNPFLRRALWGTHAEVKKILENG